MSQKKTALVICIHNSARSQMGAAYLRSLGGEQFEAESAGIEPGQLNPWVVRALAEDGIDISGIKPQGVFDLHKAGRTFDYIIAVCDKEAAERCPIFPGKGQRIHWPFPDPSALTKNPDLSDEAKMQGVREIRDLIKARIQEFISTGA